MHHIVHILNNQPIILAVAKEAAMQLHRSQERIKLEFSSKIIFGDILACADCYSHDSQSRS